MSEQNSIKLFETERIRTYWDNDQEKWYFSIVDVVSILAQNDRPRKYWSDLKRKLNNEGSELSEKIGRLRMRAEDGKLRLTDVADTEQLFRIIQSIPSPKAEPFKQWLALVGSQRLDEISDPEKAFERGVATYKQKGYSDNWINQRVKSIQVRKGLTDEWNRSGIKQGSEYAILTDELTKAWANRSVKEYKELKGLKNESLRDNTSDVELIFNMLAEASTKEISEAENPKGLSEGKNVARRGGTIAGNARKELEKQTKKSVITPGNAKDAKRLDSGLVEDNREK